MHNIIKFGRWLVHKVALALLANAVAIAIPLYAIGSHVTDSAVLKDWLARTNTYETIINESLDLIELDAQNAQSQGSLGDTLNRNPFINASIIADAMRQSLSPEYIQSQTENFIDGAARWLNKETDRPVFTFSLAEKQDELELALNTALTKEFSKMPDCLPEEIPASFDLLQSFCKPPGVNIQTEVDKLVSELAGDEGVLSGAEWDGDDLIRDEGEGSGLSQTQVAYVKAAYSGLQDGPLFLMLLGFLSIPLLFFSSRSRYKGFTEVGTTLFSGSLFIFVPALIVSRWENIITSLIGDTGVSGSTVEAARAILEPFIQAAVSDIATLTALMSGAVLVMGALVLIVGVYFKKQYRDVEEDALVSSIKASKERRKIQEIKKKAKKHQMYKHLTKDPVTKKPLKPKKDVITVHHARKIARDPASKVKKISELKEEIEK